MFMTLVKENMDELKTMGVRQGGICTYYFKKGVATMVASGFTVSPPIFQSTFVLDG